MRRLLLCDDAADYRALVRTVLGEQDDFAVAGEASDGRACVDCLADVAPDVVLLDMDMPRMGGMEALPLLRERLPSATIVVLSTVRTADLERRALALGAAAYVEKPRNVLELPGLLRAALEAGGDDPAPGELVERVLRLWDEGRESEALALMDEEVRYEPLTHAGVHGIAEMARVAAELEERHPDASVTPIVLLERGEHVVVLAHARLAREHLAAAWVFRVSGSRIAYVKTYGDWSAAQAAAGMEGEAYSERSLLSA